MMKTKALNLLITTGDVDGVGLEVTVAALLAMGVKPSVRYIVYADTNAFKFERKRLSSKFKIASFASLNEALAASPQGKSVSVILNDRAPAHWVKEAALRCLSDPSSFALVTGPLSKTGIKDAGFRFIGHTEMLKDLSQKEFLFQTYLGAEMNVLLVTDHIALEKVPSALKQKRRFKAAVGEVLELCRDLKLKKPVVCLGLDPHTGESGLIGSQDQEIKAWLAEIPLEKNQKILGPLPSDSAFEARFRKGVGFYIALYHDQGLIPFKTLHGFDQGVHLTLGLPFVRTSVDHGTAKNLFRKRRANPGSMKDAIKTAISLMEKFR